MSIAMNRPVAYHPFHLCVPKLLLYMLVEEGYLDYNCRENNQVAWEMVAS